VSERVARTLLASVIVAIGAATVAVDLPSLSGGTFWGDGATYYCMASSLAQDGDLRYEVGDLLRVKREFPAGPQGVFLKRGSGGFVRSESFPWLRRVPADKPQIYYAKPFVYSLAAAPLVRVLGARGLLLTNVLCLAAALVAGYFELRRRTSPGRALAASLVIFLATVAPVYLLWPAPELFNMALVALGLVAWRRDRPLLSAVLLGIATYSKPYNLWLALPLGLAPLLPAQGVAFGGRLLDSVRRGVVFAGTVALCFGLNGAVTGELNYQGGAERKTFYGKFPGEVAVVDGVPQAVTFGNAGIWMSTNAAGPRVEGEDVAPASQGAEPPRAPEEFRQSFLYNLAYFWIGRFGGALPYFFPAVLALSLFLTLGPRDAGGWLAFATLAVSFPFYIAMIPDNWYGGSGTVGNRYFLNLLPLAILLLPRGREVLLAVAGALGAAVFVGPILLAPMHHSIHHGAHGTRPAFLLLPTELTMLNDLAIFTETWRKKQPFGDTEGDAWRHWPADPKAYYLYFPDDGTYGREQGPSGLGFWLRGGRRAEVIVRALEPVRQMHVRIAGGDAGDEVEVGLGGASERAIVGPGQTAEVRLTPGAAFLYKDTFVHVLELRSTRGHAGPDGRSLGAFVAISLEVARRPRR
jgi:hypothetical protein